MAKMMLEVGKRYRYRFGAWYLCVEALPNEDKYLLQQEQGGRLIWIHQPHLTENGGLEWDYAVTA